MDIVDPVVDYLALATLMGGPARRIERASDITAAIQAENSTGLQNLIEILVQE